MGGGVGGGGGGGGVPIQIWVEMLGARAQMGPKNLLIRRGEKIKIL